MKRFHALIAACTTSLVGLAACSSSSAPGGDACDVTVDRACTPAYEPTFDNLFQKTFKPSCALSGASCHAPEGRKAGLVFENADTAHRLLLDGRVTAGKPECSLLTRRILSTDTAFMMPPGLALAPGEQCAIIQWMARGAQR
ncbi:MAG TPA: c-type cytochrome domain-containing protein [Labilithrix sp.]|nr:c-type cytochrome domain-containing protein [Labilithrix sp.]